MARIARVVVSGIAHHVTQRGNRRQKTFFHEDDYKAYAELLSEWCERCGVQIWAYCLMPNHVHLIAVPETADSLRRGLGEAHRRYTRGINFREGWRGHLWQERFASFPMDERYLLAAARYVELNPVRARLADKAWEYPWSSAKAHVKGRDDSLVQVRPLLERVEDWKEFLSSKTGREEMEAIRLHEKTGRPLGETGFVKQLERRLDRILAPLKPGPKPKGRKGES